MNMSIIKAQRMVICNDIDRQGNCNGATHYYEMADSTGPIMCIGIFADSAKTLGTEGLVIKVYKIVDGKEVKFGSDLIKETQRNWVYCWKRFLFSGVGNYIIKIYDENENVICSDDFTLSSKLNSTPK
jgi:hypothetical protein